MGTKKMGRPKTVNPKSEIVTLRLTPDEKNILDICCKECKMVRRDFVMNCVNKVYQDIKEEK